MEKTIINVMEHIEDSEVKEFYNTEVHFCVDVNVDGKISFSDCVIHYNGDAETGRIILGADATLEMVNTTIICDSLKKDPFVYINESGKVHIESCTFERCSNFLETNFFGLKEFSMYNCRIRNFTTCFLYMRGTIDSTCDIENNVFVFDEKPDEIYEGIETWRWGICISDFLGNNYRILFKNNTVIFDDVYTGNIKKKESFISSNHMKIVDSSFYGIDNCVIKASSFENCRFEKCKGVISEAKNIKKCLFLECTDIMDSCNDLSIADSSFIKCSNDIIKRDFLGGVKIAYCNFYNISETKNGNDVFHVINLISNPALITLGWNSKYKTNNTVENCTFNGISLKEKFLIASDTSDKPGSEFTTVSRCTFKNCQTQRSSKKIIKEWMQVDSLFGKQDLHATLISDCVGLDAINTEGGQAPDEEIKDLIEKMEKGGLPRRTELSDVGSLNIGAGMLNKDTEETQTEAPIESPEIILKRQIMDIEENLTDGINVKIVDCWPDYDGVKYFTAYNGDEMWTEVGVESGLIKKNIDIRSNPAGAWTEMLISFGMSKRIFYQGDQASYQSVKSFFDENYGDRGIEVMYEDCGSLPEKEKNRDQIIKDAIDGIVEVAENLSDGINLKIIDCWPDYDGVKYLSAHEGDQLWKELGEESGLIKKSIDIRKSPAEAWTEILISFGVCKSIYYMGEETECLKLKEFFDSNYGDLGISISYLGGATWEL